jgi:uncharacterized membrane protein YkoI
MKQSEKTILGVLVAVLIVANISFFVAGFGNMFTEEDAKTVALKLVPGEIQEVELENQNGQLIYEVDVASGDGEKEVKIDQQGNVIQVEDEEIDVPITGSALEKASQAALAYMGEGKVTDSEIGDEEGYYEIEITLDNGGEADVHLDKNFNVLSVEYN